MKNNNFLDSSRLIFFKKVLLLLSAILLFVLSNPNIIFNDGLGFLAFFIYLPVLLLISKSSIKSVWIYGLFYGALSYGIYAYWLSNFHPLGLYIVCISYGLILALVFLGLKTIELLFNEKAWIVQFLFICSYEYLKTLGFIGFNYGVSAYALWKYTVLIQIVDIAGVFGLNLIVIFPSALLFTMIKKKSLNKLIFVWMTLFISVIFYGLIDLKKGNPTRYTKVIAIQNNENPWKNGIAEYKQNVARLMELTDKALAENPDAEYVVWPETAIAPSILDNYYGKEDFQRYELIYNLLFYINKKNCTFVIGNANQTKLKDGTVERYNSAFVFEPGENVIPPEPYVYSKIKLVPFTEDFPYKNIFPKLYEKLLNGDTHMWEKGESFSVYSKDDFAFGTPICFEDTFSYTCREFVKNGAMALFNLSNDAWSKSKVCQTQHLSMAVFRSVENRIPSVRSTSSGQTCVINQHGKIINMAEAFTESYAAGKIPVYKKDFKKSFYTKTGDLFGVMEVVIFAVILLIQIIRVIIQKNNKSA